MTDDTQHVVADGDVILVDVLRWHEGWDFDCPVCIIRPVIQFSPNGEHAEEMVESLCEDVALDGKMRDDGTENGVIDRQFSLATLKRRWAEARAGKEFPQKQYEATRYRVRFFKAIDGDMEFLSSEIEEEPT